MSAPLLRISPESAGHAWKLHPWHEEIARFRLPPRELLAIPGAILTAGNFLGPEKADGGVYDAQGHYVASARHLRRGRNLTAPAPVHTQAATDLPRLNGRYLYLGWFFNHYGHFLLESFSRCWAIGELQGVDGYLFHLHAPRPLPRKRLLVLFSLLGVSPEKIHFVEEPLRVGELLVPSQQAVLGRAMHHTVLDLYPRMARRARERTGTLPASEKLYLSRRLLPPTMRKAANEKALEDHFAKRGYQILHPQHLDLTHQLALYLECRAFGGLDGSGLHNVLFSEEPEQMWILGAENRLADAITQVLINRWRHCKTHLILQQLPQTDILPPQLMPFWINGEPADGAPPPPTPPERLSWLLQLSRLVEPKVRDKFIAQAGLSPEEACLLKSMHHGRERLPQCLDHYSHSAMARLFRADEHLSQGQPLAALELLEPLLPDQQNDPLFLERYARALKALGRTEAALATTEKAVALDPGNPELALFHAELQEAAKGAATALPLVEKLVSSFGAFTPARIRLAELLAKNGEFPRAAAVLRELLQESPEQAGLWTRLTWYLYRAGHCQEAEEAALKALEHAPQNPFSRTHLARIHLCLGNPKQAFCWIEEALAQAPGKQELQRLKEQILRELAPASGLDDTGA